MLNQWTEHYTKYEAMDLLGKAGVPAGAVFDTMELSSDPSLREREIFVTVQHPARGDFLMPGWPVKMSESYVKVEASPLLGADNEAVYTEWLGLTATELNDLHKQGVI